MSDLSRAEQRERGRRREKRGQVFLRTPRSRVDLLRMKGGVELSEESSEGRGREGKEGGQPARVRARFCRAHPALPPRLPIGSRPPFGDLVYSKISLLSSHPSQSVLFNLSPRSSSLQDDDPFPPSNPSPSPSLLSLLPLSPPPFLSSLFSPTNPDQTHLPSDCLTSCWTLFASSKA